MTPTMWFVLFCLFLLRGWARASKESERPKRSSIECTGVPRTPAEEAELERWVEENAR